MNELDALGDPPGRVISSARAAEHAIQQLCRTTLTRPSLTPAEVDSVLAHLADVAAALPQAARQLGDILAQANEDQVLEMDILTETVDPGLTIEAARLHLDGGGEAALELYRLLDAAHNETTRSPQLNASRSTPKSTPPRLPQAGEPAAGPGLRAT